MNPRDTDPSLYASFRRMPREWYRRRQAAKHQPSHPRAGDGHAGCRV